MKNNTYRSRIAILAPLKRWGGLEGTLLVLCQEFIEQGIIPELWLSRGGLIPYQDQLPVQVKIRDLRTKGKLDSIIKAGYLLRQHRPDALLTVKDHGAKVAVLAKKIFKIKTPVFITVSNTLSRTVHKKVKRFTIKHLYPLANKVIAVSEGVKKDLVQEICIPKDMIQVIYNPAFTLDVEQQSTQDTGHPWLDQGNLPVFIGVGRLTPQKDFSTLIRAFSIVRNQMSSKLIIIGEGNQRSQLEHLIHELDQNNNIDLPGYLNNPLPWMARASVFVLSSRYEGLGNVLIEAMSVGTPVIATDCPSGPREILDKGKLGHLVPIENAEALAHAMLKTIHEPQTPAKLQAAVQQFRSDIIANQYLQLMGLA